MMRNWRVLVLLFLAVSRSGSALASLDFGLIDQQGVFHQLSRYGDDKAVVLLPFSYHDQTSLQIAHDLAGMAEQLAAQQVRIWLLNASEEPDYIRSQPAPGGLPVLIDSSQTVASTLEVQVLGELIVLQPASSELLYRGINDVQQLAPALVELLAAAAARRPSRLQAADTALAGTELVYRFREQFASREISYPDEIAPLLQARCAFCHVENGLAPWAMNRHLMVLGWSPMMRETLITRRMPPGQIDNAVGDWVNTHELTDHEMALLIEWIDQRAPNPSGRDPLAERAAPPETMPWMLGEPDLIVDVPEQQIPATGNVDFIVARSALDISEAQWIRAVAYQVGDRSVLHSLLIYAVDEALQSDDADTLIAADNAEFISVYVPGESEDVFADGAAYRLPADSDLVFKLRYLTSGRPTVDRTRIGFYFLPQMPERQLRTLALEKTDFKVPANMREHTEVQQSPALEQDMWLQAYSPHAHSRGKSMSLTAIYPDGKEEMLINVANFNYNWQLTYRLAEPKRIPRGSIFRAQTVYDNSSSNPFNPAPEDEAEPGYRFNSEMFSHFLRLAY